MCFQSICWNRACFHKFTNIDIDFSLCFASMTAADCLSLILFAWWNFQISSVCLTRKYSSSRKKIGIECFINSLFLNFQSLSALKHLTVRSRSLSMSSERMFYLTRLLYTHRFFKLLNTPSTNFNRFSFLFLVANLFFFHLAFIASKIAVFILCLY